MENPAAVPLIVGLLVHPHDVTNPLSAVPGYVNEAENSLAVQRQVSRLRRIMLLSH